MFIQTEKLPDECDMRFLPGREVYLSGPISLDHSSDLNKFPLASRLLAIDHVIGVILENESLVIKRSNDIDWLQLKPAVLGAVMDHFVADLPVCLEETNIVDNKVLDEGEFLFLNDSDPVVDELKELIETRIRPAASQGGGDVKLRGYNAGVVYVQFEGQAFQLLSGIENMLKHYVPEVERVADYRDAIPKPGLDTPEGRAIKEILDTRVNPSVAAHGGHISLIDVVGPRAFIRMEGGCQGCGMANATLKDGVEVEIKKEVPSIQQVLDVTDHAEGTNPYYQSA
ncbi:MAG: NifU family protein [Rhodospirillaceae bacterium]